MEKFIGVWTWLVTWPNPLKPKGHLKRLDHVPTNFTSRWTFWHAFYYLYLLCRMAYHSEFLTYRCFYVSNNPTVKPWRVRLSLWRQEKVQKVVNAFAMLYVHTRKLFGKVNILLYSHLIYVYQITNENTNKHI